MISYAKKRSLKKLGPILDKINIVLSVVILLCAIMLIVDRIKYAVFFPILFSVSALLNLCLAIKSYKMAEMGRMVVLLIAFIILTALSIMGYIVTLS